MTASQTPGTQTPGAHEPGTQRSAGRSLVIGTKKGLFLAERGQGGAGGDSWQVSGPHFPMTEVYAAAVDHRRDPPRLLAGVTSPHYGPTVALSDDGGHSWREPEQAPVAFPADSGATVERVWQLVPGPVDQPGRVYAGTQPSALFVSDDGGVSFTLVRGLWDHPHRDQWYAGFGGQAVHTVLPRPDDPRAVQVAMSTGGVYATVDGGASWHPRNSGIRMPHSPEPYPEFGQCVHKVARDPAVTDRLYAQNHHGVYRSDDDGHRWVSIADGLPSDFGFPIVAHPHRAGTVWTFPMSADADRFPAEYRCRVYRSVDAGGSWQALSAGLPAGPFYPSVLRDAMCTDDGDPAGVYVGTRSGEVYASGDEGDSWQPVAAHLPDVLCLRAWAR